MSGTPLKLSRKDLASDTWKRIVEWARLHETEHLRSIRSFTCSDATTASLRGRLAEISDILAADPRTVPPGKQPSLASEDAGDAFERTRQRAETE